MENLEKLIYDLYKKNARQCTNEEIYNALLIYTKNQLFEKGYQDGKKKIYYISAVLRWHMYFELIADIYNMPNMLDIEICFILFHILQEICPQHRIV